MKFKFKIGSGNKKKSKTTYIILAAVYVFVLLFSLHVGVGMEQSNSHQFLDGLLLAFNSFANDPFDVHITSYFGTSALLMSVIFGFAILYLKINQEKYKHDMPDKENGSAKWNDDMDAYNKTYTDPYGSKENNGPKNMILSQDVFLNMDTRKTLRNNNILVVGGSGAGKSRFVVKPNILQANCNYIITDPSGELLSSCGTFLEKQGYEIKVFNLVEMAKSDQYNPFEYVRDDLGVLMMINCLIRNTNPDGKSGGDPFWEKSETALLQALCFYLKMYCPKQQQNFTSVMKLLRAAEVDENNPAMKSKLDRIFDEVAVKDPNSIALKQYLTFKMGAGRTLKSILISCSVRLTVFNMKQIENLTKVDTINLGSLGEGKKALFVIIPAADSTYNFLVSMMYSQLFETLYYIAETQCEGQRLKTPVRFLLDEFANIGHIPEFTKKLATMRKYEISCTIILQNLAQIKTMYKDDWGSILGNCDSFLFLGGQEYDTLDYISKQLGKMTIRVKNHSVSGGKKGGGSISINKSGRELMTPEELSKMKTNECVLIIRGLDPFFGKKYEYTKHPNYHLTGDSDKKLLYINTRDNSEKKTFDEIENEYNHHKATSAAKRKAELLEKARQPELPRDKKNNPIDSVNLMMNDLKISNPNDLKKTLVLASSEELQNENKKSENSQSDENKKSQIAEADKKKDINSNNFQTKEKHQFKSSEYKENNEKQKNKREETSKAENTLETKAEKKNGLKKDTVGENIAKKNEIDKNITKSNVREEDISAKPNKSSLPQHQNEQITNAQSSESDDESENEVWDFTVYQ